MALIWLVLASFLHGQEELSIESFWLGDKKFEEEVISLKLEYPKRVVPEVSMDESRFLSDGDRLWDLQEHYRKVEIEAEGGWILYNETTGYLVAKANQATLGALELRYLPERVLSNLRLGFEFFEVEDERVEWVQWVTEWKKVEKKSLFTMEVLGRTRETVTQEFTDKKGFLVNVEARMCEELFAGTFSLRLFLDVESDSIDCTLATRMELFQGEDHFLELGVLESGNTLVAVLGLEAAPIGGPALLEWHLYEGAPPVESLPIADSNSFVELEKDREYLMRYYPAAHQWMGIKFTDLGKSSRETEDPFDDEDDFGKEFKSRYPEVTEVPVSLKERFPREQWIDLSQLFSDSGVEIGKGDFVYYGRLGTGLLARNQSVTHMDLVNQITVNLRSRRPKILQTAFTFIREIDGKRERLAKGVVPACSGETAGLEWVAKDGSFELEVQPSRTADNRMIDLRFAVAGDGQMNGQVTSNVTYQDGFPLEFLLHRSEGQATILRLEVVQADLSGRAVGK